VTELTGRQKKILDWVLAFAGEHGMPPTVREIGSAFSISSAGVFGHLKALERKGFLKRGARGARSLSLGGREKPDAPAVRSLPLLGRIAAGSPVLAVENAEGMIAVDPALMRMKGGGAAYFALSVKGDSMIEDGILDGDVVIVEKQSTARQGQIVVALLDDEATLKRFFREGDRFRLQPANSSMEPIYVDSVEVQGVVRGVMRSI
jgi:repressor LexA